MKIFRPVMAFALAPLVVPMVFFAAGALRRRFPDALGPPAIPHASVIYLGLIAPLAYAPAFVLGAPALYVFRRQGWRQAWSFGVAGAAIGFVVGVGLCFSDRVFEGYALVLVTSVIAGGVSALVFRGIVGTRT